MAETLVSKIVANAGKNWSRNTVADGNWLNANTIVKLNQNDKTLAEAIDDLSASMPHILPEYPGFKLNFESNETIKSIEQKTTGELIVEKQGIDIESTTLNDKLWAHLNTNDFRALTSDYSQLYYNGGDYSPQLAYVEPGSQGDGCTTTALGLSAGIYSIYLELSYKLAEQDSIEAIEKEVFVGLYNGDTLLDEISFHVNDTYKEIEQHRLVNAVVKFASDGTLVIKGKTETGHVNGGLKINNLYIVSVGGATGPKGDPGNPGADGFSPTIEITEGEHQHTIKITDSTHTETTLINDGANGKTPELSAKDYHIKWKYTDESNWTDLGDFRGEQGETGDNGKSLSATFVEDSVNRQTQVKIGQENGSEQTSFNLPWGNNGISGTSISARVVEDHANKKSTVTLFDPYSSPEHIIQTFEVKDGADGTGTGDVTTQQLNAAIDGLSATVQNEYQTKGDYVTSAANLFDTTHKYGLVKDNQGNVSWGQISEGSTYNFDNTQSYHTLSGDGSTNPIGVNTDLFYKKTETSGASELSTEFGKYVQKSGDTMTGPLVVNCNNGSRPIVGISQETTGSDQWAVFGATRKHADDNNYGTTWFGVGRSGAGVLKNVPDTSTSAATEGTAYTQITFDQENGPNNTKQIPKIQVNVKSSSQGGDGDSYRALTIPTSAYTNMDTFDPTNGPNYMLRKTENGFTIGAKVVNVTSMPQNTEANTYYFVYEV